MMIKTGGELHYYINGLDQGIASSTVPAPVWAVVDLYGMTVKVSFGFVADFHMTKCSMLFDDFLLVTSCRIYELHVKH